MRARLHMVLLACSMLLATLLNGQVFDAPRLLCARTQVNGDVALTWALPSVSCGSFNSYDIYGSQNEFSGYALIGQVTNQATTTWLHAGADGNNKTWYYHLRSNFNCAGYTALRSDTLDNHDPVAPDLRRVTVVGDDVQLYWPVSPSPETRSYIIYRNRGAGFNPIDTIHDRLVTSYVDTTSLPAEYAEQYTIASIDTCGNTGPFSLAPHRSIKLVAVYSTCSEAVKMEWNAYENWPAGVLHYNIYHESNGGGFVLDTQVHTLTRDFTKYGAGDSICLYVEAVDGTGSILSMSNVICGRTSELTPASSVILSEASVATNSSVDLRWFANPLADVSEFRIYRGTKEHDLFPVHTVFVTGTTPAVSTYIDPTNPGEESYYYQIEALDDCQNLVQSQRVRTILLQGRPKPNFENELTWNAYQADSGVVDSYQVYLLDPVNGPQWVSTYLSLPDEVEHNISAFVEGEGIFCYEVLAYGRQMIRTDTFHFVSRSNQLCVKQFATFFAPTAIAPQGHNREFRPVISFFDEGSYNMKIFNRWGLLLFESNDIDQGWDGTFGGEIVPVGVYSWLIRFRGDNNTPVVQSGSVMVLR